MAFFILETSTRQESIATGCYQFNPIPARTKGVFAGGTSMRYNDSDPMMARHSTHPPPTEERFRIDPFEPAYLAVHRRGGLAERVDAALEELEDCRACPRDCGTNRLEDRSNVCCTGRHARVASYGAHHGEEDCLRGHRGSGTLFFSLCNLRCVYCQNWDISQKAAGDECDASRIADLMLMLQDAGCHNINFVTPEHVVPQVIEAIAEAVPRGLEIPIVYNTSAYDTVRSLRLLDGLIDIYMPDFKFWERKTSIRLSRAKDYAESARAAISEMHRQVGPLKFGPDGVARRGVLVRHLVMPGQLDETASIVGWLADEISPDTYVNIMAQYRPAYRVGTPRPGTDGPGRYPEIDRRPTREEVEEAYRLARSAGLWRFDERVPA
jgi:putative pyruvate formate lyase activating enzyme